MKCDLNFAHVLVTVIVIIRKCKIDLLNNNGYKLKLSRYEM